jgi:uncharacterized protein GlcG (DUF336 family)
MINDAILKRITYDLVSSLKNNKLTLEIAKELLESAEKKAIEINVPVVIAIVDEGGNLVAQHRMDNSLLVSISLALSKAYTSIALKMTTEKLSKITLPGKPLYGLESLGDKKICIIGGGIPIIINGNLIGSIGVSGGTVEEDILIAEYSLLSLDKFLQK